MIPRRGALIVALCAFSCNFNSLYLPLNRLLRKYLRWFERCLTPAHLDSDGRRYTQFRLRLLNASQCNFYFYPHFIFAYFCVFLLLANTTDSFIYTKMRVHVLFVKFFFPLLCFCFIVYLLAVCSLLSFFVFFFLILLALANCSLSKYRVLFDICIYACTLGWYLNVERKFIRCF